MTGFPSVSGLWFHDVVGDEVELSGDGGMANWAFGVFVAVGWIVVILNPRTRLVLKETFLHPRSRSVIYRDSVTGKLVSEHEVAPDRWRR